MDIVKFEQFVKVCECKSLTKAAEELFISQPALSQAISVMEDYFSCKLFDREGKKLVLNEKGKLAYQYSLRILDNISELKGKLIEGVYKTKPLKNSVTSLK